MGDRKAPTPEPTDQRRPTPPPPPPRSTADTDVERGRAWELLHEDEGRSKTERLRLYSGWLVRTTVIGLSVQTGEITAIGVAMVFVPATTTR